MEVFMQKNFNLAICFLLILLSLFCLGNISPGKVEAETNSKEIIVYGCGKLTATPDTAIVNIGVENTNENLDIAIEENNKTMEKIISYLKENGMNEDDISTTNYSVYKKFNYSNGEKFLGYQVDNSLQFKSSNLENLNAILEELTALGANKIEGVTFTCQNLNNYYNEALKLALENAKTKVKSLTDEELKVCKITEKSLYCNEICRDSAVLLAKSNYDFLAKGNLQIEAKIEVVFC